MIDQTMTVSRLICYPIKSTAGISVQEIQVNRHGYAADGVQDHGLMVIDERGIFVTQRKDKNDGPMAMRGIASMCLIKPSVVGNELIIRAPQMSEIRFPIGQHMRRRQTAHVWKRTYQVQEVDPEVSMWFTEFLNREAGGRYRLVRKCDDFDGLTSDGEGITTFTDGYPLLITSEESLGGVNRRMDGPPVDHDRFRPSIVFSGCKQPHDEDRMRSVKVGDAFLSWHSLCDRCPMPGIDQATAALDGRPLQALAKYRRMKPGSSKVQFGSNFNHKTSGTIRVGDDVTVLRWAPA